MKSLASSFPTKAILAHHIVRAAAEHHARSANPGPPKTADDLVLDDLIRVTAAPRPFPFHLTGESHAVATVSETELLALVETLRKEPARRRRRAREEVLSYIAACLDRGDAEWTAYLAQPEDRARRWAEVARKFRARP